MKKMLILLFLLFSLGTKDFSSATHSLTLDHALVEKITTREILIESIFTNIEEEVNKAYLASLPIGSPMAISDIERMTSDYGMRMHPILKRIRMHNGVDLSGKTGTSIYSTAKGIIIAAGYSMLGYGNQVLIDHQNGYCTRYAHLDRIKVNVGEQVQRGDIIGTLGSTGLSTGPHLHYETIKGDQSIDPFFFTYKEKEERSFDNYVAFLVTLDTAEVLGV